MDTILPVTWGTLFFRSLDKHSSSNLLMDTLLPVSWWTCLLVITWWTLLPVTWGTLFFRSLDRHPSTSHLMDTLSYDYLMDTSSGQLMDTSSGQLMDTLLPVSWWTLILMITWWTLLPVTWGTLLPVTWGTLFFRSLDGHSSSGHLMDTLTFDYLMHTVLTLTWWTLFPVTWRPFLLSITCKVLILPGTWWTFLLSFTGPALLNFRSLSTSTLDSVHLANSLSSKCMTDVLPCCNMTSPDLAVLLKRLPGGGALHFLSSSHCDDISGVPTWAPPGPRSPSCPVPTTVRHW
jgi:hypothetical protein